MHDKLRYINSKGDVIEFGQGTYLINENDLRDFEWKYDTYGSRITAFKKEISSKKVPILVYDSENWKEVFDKLHNVLEYDTRMNERGRLYVNGYYLRCNFIISEKADYTSIKGYMANTYTLVTDNTMWIKEDVQQFRANGLEDDGSEEDFPYDYMYDFTSGLVGKELSNDEYFDSEFEITVYGACENPAINIAGHEYEVGCTIETGEYLKINSLTRKIYKTKTNGEIINEFNLRGRDSYIFEKIPAGRNSITWSGLFGFDVALLHERSEPEWT